MRRTFLSLLFVLAFLAMPVSLAAAAGELPDLLPTGFDVADDGTISYTLSNQGDLDIDGEASASSTVILTAEDGTQTEFDDNPFATSDLVFLSVGGSSTIEVGAITEPGIYTIEVCVDVNEELEESDETNNCLTDQFGWRTQGSDSGSTTTTTTTDTTVDTTSTDTTTDEGTTDGADEETMTVDAGAATDEEVVDEATTDEEVELTEETACEISFMDVDADYEYYDSICALYENNIVHGRTDETFAPEDYILRGEAAKIIARLWGYVDLTWDRENEADLCEVSASSYSDLSTEDPYICVVEALTEENIASGYEDGTFRAHQEMTGDEINDLMANVGYSVEVEDEQMTRGAFVDMVWNLFNAE